MAKKEINTQTQLAEMLGVSKNQLSKKKEELENEKSVNIEKLHYIEKELLSAKIEDLQNKIITKDSLWVNQQTAIFIATFDKLKSIKDKNSVEYFVILQKSLLQL